MVFSSATLKEAVRALSPLVSTAGMIPALTYFRLDVTGPNEVWASASDGSALLRLRIPCTTEKGDEGSVIMVPSKKLTEVMRFVGDDDLRIKPTSAHVAVSFGKTSMKFAAFTDAHTFIVDRPQVDGSFGHWENIPAAALSTALHAVAPAVGNDAARPNLSGAVFVSRNNQLTLEAMNGWVLTRRTVVGAQSGGGTGVFSVPREHISNMVRALEALSKKDGAATVSISANATQCLVYSDSLFFYVSLIALPNNKWINIDEFINTEKEAAVSFKVSKQALLTAIQKTSVAADDKDPSLQLTMSKQALAIAVISEEAQASDTVDIEVLHGNQEHVAHYLINSVSTVLSTMNTDDITITISSKNNILHTRCADVHSLCSARKAH